MPRQGVKRDESARKREAAPTVAALDTKLTPSQDRARSTFEAILTTTGQLLAEVGFERLSTNMICERAGLTPPALYRYFPNKYAVLKELAGRLMDRQDEAVFDWIESGGAEAATLEEAIAKTRAIQERVVQITREEPGGLWTMRAIRAVPMLRDVRLASRDKVADRLFERMRVQYPDSRLGQLRIATRLSTELMYAATEMVIEEPDRDVESITSEVSAMVAGYYRALAAPG
jgi:AcrR family transcriptional regulator